MTDGNKLFENLKKVQDRIASACGQAGREPEEITLVAVTKSVEVNSILKAYEWGLRSFGENRVQEAQNKISSLREAQWHLIGHLQRNKISKALDLNFDIIESLDSLELAQSLSGKLSSRARTQKVLLEINIANEPKKHGFGPEAAPEAAAKIRELKNLNLVGVMTLGPDLADANLMRPYFAKTRKIFEELKIKNTEFKILSMGMSKDFEVAIEEGASMIRVGRAIFKCAS